MQALPEAWKQAALCFHPSKLEAAWKQPGSKPANPLKSFVRQEAKLEADWKHASCFHSPPFLEGGVESKGKETESKTVP
jgi:hypothetical protein